MPKAETPEPIALDVPNDPEVSQLLDELDAFLKEGGVDTSVICAREVTRLRHLEGQPSAIPDREAWPAILRVCLHGFMPIREECDFPIVVLGGYRPNEYNAKVRGHRASRHLFGEALDLAPVTKGLGEQEASDRRLALAKAAAWLFKEHGTDHGGMGFGAYGRPAPHRIHIDFGHRQRWWDDAAFYNNMVKKETRSTDPKPSDTPSGADAIAKIAEKWWDNACYDPELRDGFVRAATSLEREVAPRTDRDWRLLERGYTVGRGLRGQASSSSDRVNVMLFGAVADGVTDDTDAFRDAAKKDDGVLFIPDGLYRLGKL